VVAISKIRFPFQHEKDQDEAADAVIQNENS
jgi:hypothetical protein